jgi:HEAT repeat protein
VHETTVESLTKLLARTNPAEARRAGAWSLGRLGSSAASAIGVLVIATTDREGSVREAALNALPAIDPAWMTCAQAHEAIPGLVAALKSNFTEVSEAASRTLHLIGAPVIPALVAALLSGEDTPDKVYSMRLLARMGPGAVQALPGLTQALGSQFLQTRLAAAAALTALGPLAAPAVPALVACLRDPYADARQAAAACLARVGAAAEPAVPALLPLLADRESRVRDAAVAALERIGPQAVPGLITIIETRDVRRLKAWAESATRVSWWYRKFDPEHVLDPEKVATGLSWEAYDILEEQASLEAAQEAALRVLGGMGPAAAEARPAITRALTDRNPSIALAAINALGRVGPLAEGAAATLIQLLVHDSRPIREAAARVLATGDYSWAADPGVDEALAALTRCLSRSGSTGQIALEACIGLGKVAVSALAETLGTGDRIARENAARALGRIGPAAGAAIPALTQALQDSHPWVQNEAAKALALVEGHAA